MISHCIHPLHFVSPLIDACMGYFHILAIVNSPMNIHVKLFAWAFIFNFPNYMCNIQILSHMVPLSSNFEELPNRSQSTKHPFPILPATCEGSNFPTSSRHFLWSSVTTNLVDVQCHMALTKIS